MRKVLFFFLFCKVAVAQTNDPFDQFLNHMKESMEIHRELMDKFMKESFSNDFDSRFNDLIRDNRFGVGPSFKHYWEEDKKKKGRTLVLEFEEEVKDIPLDFKIEKSVLTVKADIKKEIEHEMPDGSKSKSVSMRKISQAISIPSYLNADKPRYETEGKKVKIHFDPFGYDKDGKRDLKAEDGDVTI